MIKNYFKIAWRNLQRNRAFATMNILGLAIGMASAILILLWVENELNIDQSFPKSAQYYQMFNRDKFNGAMHAWGTTPICFQAIKTGVVNPVKSLRTE